MAKERDVAVILRILADGRAAQRMQGFMQWSDDYPGEDVIADDISLGAGRIMHDGTSPAGYAALILSDPAYGCLDNLRSCSGSYAVVHRLALAGSYRGKGLSVVFMRLLEEDARSRGVRMMYVDTGEKNAVMRHLMDKLGYLSLGEHTFSWGNRLAFGKRIE